MTSFSMAGDAPSRSLSVFYADGNNATVPESHLRFQELLDLLISGAGDSKVKDLVDLMTAIANRLTVLSERVTYVNGSILFDGDAISGILVDALREAFEADNNAALMPIVNFLEKVKTNPAISSVDGLWRWVNNGELTIHEDGDFYAYKGLTHDGLSVHSGKAFVDGVEVIGQIPNVVGTTVSMPRSVVDDGSHTHCSTGLHAGKWGFASTFGGGRNTVLIKVNPRDVVSVPSDEGSVKLRVCRYLVVEKVTKPLAKMVLRTPVPVPVVAQPELPDVEELVKESEPVSAAVFDVIPTDLNAKREAIKYDDEPAIELDDEADEEDEVVVEAPHLTTHVTDGLSEESKQKLAELYTEPVKEKPQRDAKGHFIKGNKIHQVRGPGGKFSKKS